MTRSRRKTFHILASNIPIQAKHRGRCVHSTMTSIDELFKKPGTFTSGSIKRKFETPDAEQAYKAAKLSSNGSPNGTNGNGATVEDEDDDVEAG